MEAKPAKCAISTAKRSGNSYKPTENPDVRIQGKEIPVYSRDKCYIYLGHEICLSNQNNQAELLVADFYTNIKKG